MDDLPQTSRWGSLALVSYIPDPLGSFLNGLRHSLTGEDTPHAHVTILPRRPLTVPVEIASEQILKVLSGFRAFAIELCRIRRFAQTNVLYVDITEGSTRLHALHDALSIGDLAYDEEFEFRPHLTLGCPESLSDIESAYDCVKTAWTSAPMVRRFMLQEIACLSLRPNGAQSEWRRLWSHNLNTPETSHHRPATLAASGQTY